MSIAILLPLFKNVLIEVGGWLARKLVEIGCAALIRLCKRRKSKLKKRVARLRVRLDGKTGKKVMRLSRRIAWIEFRIKGWNLALDFFVTKEEELTQRAAEELRELVRNKVPDRPACETLSGWERMVCNDT